ncbi:10 kDa heat shock protein, mitochondrial-like [Branchiostoma lanceolatum]|uniref:10 kDa heat shock protein, mitochondrial-like n=1 Tax=Branchiostoma lanceolatum TaxID=7740 RepID=UPI00345554AD
MARALKSFIPLFDRVLVQKLAAETTTKGGIMLPEKAVGKVLDATVVAVGPGSRNSSGELVVCSVKAGDRVLLPEYGGTKLKLEDQEYHLFRDGDILGKFLESEGGK